MTQYDSQSAERFGAEPRGASGPSLVLGTAVGAAAGAIAGAVAGAAVARMFQAELRSGDEPPIRVRHGSMLIELLDSTMTKEFAHEGNSKKWKIVRNPPGPDPMRKKDPFDVVLVTKDMTATVVLTGRDVKIEYTSGQKVHLKSSNQRTKIDPQLDLKHGASRRELVHAADGAIASIKLDGHDIYTNLTAQPDPYLQLLLLDF
jgi:hypothetical protein